MGRLLYCLSWRRASDSTARKDEDHSVIKAGIDPSSPVPVQEGKPIDIQWSSCPTSIRDLEAPAQNVPGLHILKMNTRAHTQKTPRYATRLHTMKASRHLLDTLAGKFQGITAWCNQFLELEISPHTQKAPELPIRFLPFMNSAPTDSFHRIRVSSHQLAPAVGSDISSRSRQTLSRPIWVLRIMDMGHFLPRAVMDSLPMILQRRCTPASGPVQEMQISRCMPACYRHQISTRGVITPMGILLNLLATKMTELVTHSHPIRYQHRW